MITPIREPLVEGLFYPQETEELRGMILQLLTQSTREGTETGPEATPGHPPLGLVVPNGSYYHCGSVMARGYAALSSLSPPLSVAQYSRIIILAGAPHSEAHSARSGAFLSTSGAFRTPMGTNPVDTRFQETLVSLSGLIQFNETAHLEEHGIELQLPFIHYTFGEIPVVPILLSGFTANHVKSLASALMLSLEDSPGCSLIIVSSNMSGPGDLESTQKTAELVVTAIKSRLWNSLLVPSGQSSESFLPPAGIGGLAALSLLYRDSDHHLLARGSSLSVDGNPEVVVEYACLVVV